MKKLFGLFALAFLLSSFTGCGMFIYDTPVYVDVGNSEEAFLINVENTEKQGNLPTKDILAKNLVSSKRIPITYRWLKQGWGWGNGKFVPTTKLIVVDRAPETREWSAQGGKNGNGIWVESKDSVGFSTGISITARIDDQKDAVTFLWNYPAQQRKVVECKSMYKDNYEVSLSDLADVMDKEVRTKIQEVFAEESAKLDMDLLRGKKNEIMAEIRKQVIPFFAERGITITTIGMFGGFRYENEQIQKSIDKVFQAQQDKEVAIAEAKAAEERKTALKLKGEGEAAQKLEASKGEAEAIKLVADAKAYEIEKLNSNPQAYLTLKQLEIEQARLKVWNGQYPTFLVNGQGAPNMLMQLPPLDGSSIKAQK